MLKFVLIILLLTASCLTQQNQTTSVSSNSETNVEQVEPNNVTDELIESFSDDSNVGMPHKNKVQITEYAKAENRRVKLDFFTLGKDHQWELKQTIELEKDGALSCDMQVSDFNNDGYKDVTYVSGSPARGANEIRRLFIYDKRKNELVYIKNSEDYPNLDYNKYLNCIDTMRFTGSTSVEFLKVEGDELRMFAYIETELSSNLRKVYLVDKKGKEKLLRTDKVSPDLHFAGYKSFNPPIPY